jgi:branched-chain amino acid transport system substrate-binding protein
LIGSEASAGCIASSAYFESIEHPANRAFVARWRKRHGNASRPSVDGQSTYVCVMLLARAIRRAGTTEVGAVRRAAANHRYESPQGPVWIDAENNHCFLTPRLARAKPGCEFEIFWEADAPERPDPYLSALDLSAIGAKAAPRKERTARERGHLRLVK